MVNLVRITSFGRSKQQDRAHLNYVNRFGTAIDELGNSITGREKDILNRHDDRTSWSKKISTRLSVSLPADRAEADRAYEVLKEMLIEKHDRFITAFHEDKKNGNNHSHVYLQNLDRLTFAKLSDKDLFNAEFQKRLEKEGIVYSYKKHNKLQPNMKRAEWHKKQRGEAVELDSFRNAVESSLSVATDFDSFTAALKNHGITIIRETVNSLTLQDAEGRKARLDRLFSGMKNRVDIEAEIAKNNASADRLRRAEQLFLNRLAKTAEVMMFQGALKEEIQNRINTVLSHRATSDNTQARWDALKMMKTELDKVMTREQLKQAKNAMYQQRQMKRHQSKMLRKALRAGNPIAAFVAGIAYIINAIATRHGDLNRDGITETREQELLKMKRDVLNPDQKLKNPEPEPTYNRPAPGR